MTNSDAPATRPPRLAANAPMPTHSGVHGHAVSWAAIFAGAAAAAALALVLLMLGVGLGLSSISPWAQEGLGAATVGVSSILWITLTQLAAAGLGGYLAGRLRAQWLGTPSDEVYFRDTAHGFLAWAIATLATAALLTASVGAIVGHGAHAASDVATTSGVSAAQGTHHEAGERTANRGAAHDTVAYDVDRLFRSDRAADTENGAFMAPVRGNGAQEPMRIMVHALAADELSHGDAAYLAQLVAQRTGLSQAQAESRVTDVFSDAQKSVKTAKTKARQAADEARKASAYAMLWMVIALFIGAFVASLAATWGGHQRDAVQVLID